MRAGHKVLMEVDNNILQIVGNRQEILDQQLLPRPIELLNIIINALINHNYVSQKNLITILSEGRNRNPS